MDERSCTSDIEGVSRRNARQMSPTDTVIVSDTDDDESQSRPHNEPRINSWAQIDLQAEPSDFNDTEHQDAITFHSHHDSDDDNSEQCNTETSEVFIQRLKEQHRYAELKKQLSRTQTSASAVTNSTVAFESPAPAMTSASMTSSPTSNYSTEQQSQVDSVRNLIRMKVTQNMANNHLLLNDLLNNTGSNEWATLFDTVVKQTVDGLTEIFDLIPKNATPNKSKTDGKSKEKRKHRDVHHRSAREKVPRYSDTSSLDDSFGTQSTTSKNSGRKKSIFL